MHLSLDLSKTELSESKEENETMAKVQRACQLIQSESGCPELTKKPRKHFLKFYLDISYYLCVFPYKIVPADEGEYKKNSFLLQKVLCVAVHTTAILGQTTYLRALPFGQLSENPKYYFDILLILVHTSVLVAFLYSIWNRGSDYIWLVKAVQRCPIISLWYPKKITWLMSLVTLMYVIMALTNPLFDEGDGYTWTGLLAFHVSRGRTMFFIGKESSSLEMTTSNENDPFYINATGTFSPASLSFPNAIFALFSYICSMSRWIVIYHVDLLVNVMALSLWVSVSFFVDTLRAHCCKNTITKYEALKMFASHINSAVGIIVLSYTVDSILYYATNLENLFTGKNWFSKITVIQFLISSVCWFHFASAACLKMDKFREWVRQKDNISVLPSKSVSMMLLLDEIATNTVGLSGHGLFIVNYQFVAQALTTVMTYFILVIQFKGK